MTVTINNKPTYQKKEHLINEHCGFLDSEGDFFLVTESNTIVLIDEYFPAYNLSNEYNSIERFLDSIFDATLVRAYKKNGFDITIDLK